MSACYPYTPGAPFCGKHCAHVNDHGNPCVLEPHLDGAHLCGTPPCDPNAAIKFALSPAAGPDYVPSELANGLEVEDVATGHRWRYNVEYREWEDLGPFVVTN